MILRNTAGQAILIGPLLATADGAAQTAGAAIAVRKDGVDVGAPGGALAHVSDGVWQYTPSAGETDCGIVGLILTKAATIPVPLNVLTTRLPVQTAGVLPNAAANANGGLPILSSSGTTLAYTLTNLTNLPAITANWLTATGIAADAITAAKIATGAITAAKFSANAIDAAALAADAVAEIQAGLSTYSGGDTAGTAILLARIPGTVQPQTGDSFARIGAAGAGLTELALELTLQGIAAVVATLLAVAARLDATLESSAGSYRYTAAALALAPTGGSAPTTTQIRDAILAGAPTPRDLTAVTAPTVADCLVAAWAGAAARETVVGTAYTVYRPDGVSVLRLFTLDSATEPTART